MSICILRAVFPILDEYCHGLHDPVLGKEKTTFTFPSILWFWYVASNTWLLGNSIMLSCCFVSYFSGVAMTALSTYCPFFNPQSFNPCLPFVFYSYKNTHDRELENSFLNWNHDDILDITRYEQRNKVQLQWMKCNIVHYIILCYPFKHYKKKKEIFSINTMKTAQQQQQQQLGMGLGSVACPMAIYEFSSSLSIYLGFLGKPEKTNKPNSKGWITQSNQ